MLGKVYSFKQGGQKWAQRGVDVSAISEKKNERKSHEDTWGGESR